MFSSLPNNYEGSWKLGGEVSRRGIGLHSGSESEVTLLPTDLPGFYISFSDDPENLIELKANQTRDTPLCTTLDLGGKSISTVEHLLASLIGCGLTHVHIQVDGIEIPLLDGSSLSWVEAISKVGFKPANTSRNLRPVVHKPFVINKGASVITATPSDQFKLVGIIDFPYEAIGQQMFAIELNPQNFVKEIAPARTFGFIDQIEQLKEVGLIKGGALDNALVCNGNSWINPPLRFENEPVRHKLLDLIGDLALVGLPKAQIVVYRGSHSLHSLLATSLMKECIEV